MHTGVDDMALDCAQRGRHRRRRRVARTRDSPTWSSPAPPWSVRAPRSSGKKLLSDVAEDVAEVAGWITPRIGGVGPMTRAMLLRNAVLAAEKMR